MVCMEDWLIYTRHCPRCEQGLCRIRTYTQEEKNRYFLLCDECDATWTNPDEMHIFKQSNTADAVCPNTDIPLWSSETHWATLLETIASGWFGHVYVHRNRAKKD